MKRIPINISCATKAKKENGVAAIEFALVFVVLFLFLYGITSFGAVFYIQQVVSRATEDGARAAISRFPSFTQEHIKDAVVDSMARSFVTPANASANYSSRKEWLSAQLKIESCNAATNPSNCTIKVTYPYQANSLLPSINFLGISSWMPKEIHSNATVALPTP